VEEADENFEAVHQAGARAAEVGRSIDDVDAAGAHTGQIGVARLGFEDGKILARARLVKAAA
jgi:hypothetical protein